MDANRLEQIRWLADEFGGITERDALDLIAEVERLQGENEEFRDQVTGLLESLAAKSLEVMRLADECATLRATLAAEQGKAEGAPSSRWYWSDMSRCWASDGLLEVVKVAGSWRVLGGTINGTEEHDSARAAMLHADKVDGVNS